MAATGRTNNEIAQALFVTPKTVDTHLSHTYSKLGISSRRALGAALGAEELGTGASVVEAAGIEPAIEDAWGGRGGAPLRGADGRP